MTDLNKPLNTQEAADYLGIQLSYLYKLTHKNKIKHSKPNGGQIFFRRQWLDDYAFGSTNQTQQEQQHQLEGAADDYLANSEAR